MGAAADTYYAATAVPAPPRQPLCGIVEADVCVIGGGFAGLSTALDLAERGRRVVLVEARQVGWGASGRSGGWVVAGFPAGNLQLKAAVGPKEARGLYTLSRMGQMLLADRIARYAMPGVEVETGALRCVMRGHEALLLEVRDGMAATFGVDLEVWPRERVQGVLATARYGGGLHNPESFAVHPLNLALGLAAAAESRGASIHEGSQCLGLETAGAVKRVRTAGGEVRSRIVVIACGGYVGTLAWPLAAATVPIATFAAVTEPLGGVLDTAIATRLAISDMQFATNYYRRIGPDRLLWGGRIRAWEPRPAAIARALRGDMAAFYPALREARFAFAWSGLMSFLRHEMPTLGQLAADVWYATGFGGLGLALTSMTGRLLGAAIDDGDETWRRFARFGLPFAGGPLGRIPAQMIYWKAALAGRLGQVTAHA